MIDKTIKRPIVRWHGAKWMSAPKIIEHFPGHRIYVEAYGGGGSVLMRKRECYSEVYNDRFGDIVNVFEVLRDRGMAAELVRICELTPFSRDEFTRPLNTEDKVDWARGVIFRSFAGFGSASASRRDYATGFRSSSKRSGTTPGHDWRNYPENIPAFVNRLRGVTIENKDAVAVMKQHDTPETLHYLDPPYLRSSRSANGNQYEFEMTNAEHVEMLETAKGMRGMVCISGYESDLYDSHLKGWRKECFKALADGAKERKEVLWMNYSSPKRQQDNLFDMFT